MVKCYLIFFWLNKSKPLRSHNRADEKKNFYNRYYLVAKILISGLLDKKTNKVEEVFDI